MSEENAIEVRRGFGEFHLSDLAENEFVTASGKRDGGYIVWRKRSEENSVSESLVEQPIRIQRKRTKGWKMPPNTVYVGRPTKWGNPYVPDDYDRRGRQEAVDSYRQHIWRKGRRWMIDAGGLDVRELRGKNLACFCPLNQPCHADVLLEIANAK